MYEMEQHLREKKEFILVSNMVFEFVLLSIISRK
jgi:hypothetical protein